MRKSVRVGPFRFNLSKSGIGVSAGIRGLRIGAGPRGNYVHMGRGGLYYRKSLSSKPKTLQPDPPIENLPREALELTPPIYSHDTLQEIDSDDIEQLVDSSSADIVNELNSKRRIFRLWPTSAAAGVVGTAYLAAQSFPVGWLYMAIATSILITAAAGYRDLLAKTVVILYDIEDEFQGSYASLHASFEEMMRCDAKWHLEAEGQLEIRNITPALIV